jgi:DNA-(apurinic or apyrimidinic site) lyase
LNNIDYYLENLVILRDELAKTMNQKKDAKTIVFAIKMIMYGISIIESEIQGRFPTSRE